MNRQMKDSGIAWIGEIPEGWELDTIGSLYSLRQEKVSDRDYQPLSVGKMGVVPQLETAAKTDDGDNRKLVRVGDFAINSRSDRRGSCGISAYEGSVSLINTIITPRTEMCPQFYNWLFHTELFADEFYKWGHGIVDDLWTTRWQEMKRISIPLPPLSEQRGIAEFLDTKCAEVDELLKVQEAFIDELKAYKQSLITETVTKGLDPTAKMKNSGVEWIGEIPETFEIRRLKYIGTAENGLTYSPNDVCDCTDGGILVLRSSNIQNGKLVFDDNVYVNSAPPQLYVHKGDIILCSRNGSAALVGKSAMVENDIFATFGAFMMRFHSEYNNKYIHLLLTAAISQYKQLFSTTTINQLTVGVFGNLEMPFTEDVAEQETIAAYLDTKCAEIDQLIALKQEKIETLQNYRKSLIYEYVTGKKQL